MMEKPTARRRILQLGLAGLVAPSTFALWGCGSSEDGSGSYTDPNASVSTTRTPNALIEPATLKQWMDEGKVNSTDRTSRDRVVIVTVASAAQYAAQHLPGAQLLNASTELMMTRVEGVGTITTMVLDGPSMDALVKKLCINANTTVVFVASRNQNALNVSRAYFTFRYWGFPKERLKVLNGGENAWENAITANNWPAAYALTTVAPSLTPSTFSIKSLYVNNGSSTANFNLRASIGDMINVVDRINNGTQLTDATGVAIMDDRGGNPAVFIQNAIVDDFAQYLLTGTGNTSTFKPTADLVARLNSFNVTEAKSLIYVYCASGVRASATFFVLDGILGWNVALYDGSWNQWSSYASTATANRVATAWQVDVNTAGTTTSRTNGAIATAGTSVVVDPVSNAMYSVTDPRANQILVEDKAYFTSSGSSGSGTGGGGGGSSGC